MIFLHSITVLILSFVFISCGSDNNNNNNFNNVEIRITGLSNDTQATTSKSWKWGCTEYNKQDKKNKTGDCTYRHVINKKTSHTFASSVRYGNTRSATRKSESGDNRTKYYIHVQAKSKSNIASSVKSVYALLDFNNNKDVNVTGLSNDTKALRNKEWRWGCEEYNKTDKKRKAIDCTYRYVINKKASHTFASNVKYSNTRKATQKGESGDDRTKYYIHVQAQAKSNNIASKIKSVYTLLDTTPPQALKSSNVRAPTSRSTGKTFKVTVSSLKKGDTVTIYVAGGSTSGFLGFRFLASLFSLRNTEGSICIPANAVGKATVSSGTSVTVTVTARGGTNSYYAQVVDEAGNRSPCSEVFDHTSTGGLLEVTGIATDKNPRRFKSWNWSCTTEKTLPCEYRHTINNKVFHLFDSKTAYSANNRANTTGRSDALWYLHVQAKNTKKESNVKSVSVRIDRTKPATPNSGSVTYRIIRDEGNNHDLAVTFKDLLLGDRAEIYNRANCQGRALGKENVGSNNQAVITINVRNSRQQYYGKVVDKADNSSGCGAVFTYPDDVLPVLPAVTGLTNDDVPRQIKRWTWGCTTEDTHPCDYRRIINKKASHRFATSAEYSVNNEHNTSGKADGKWYLHVQARNRAGESNVKSVYARVDNTPPKTPDSNSMSFVSSDNHLLTVTFSDSEILQGERISIYNVSTCRGRTLGSVTVDDDHEGVITFNAGSTSKRYYANIIDQAGNKGGCGFIFSYPSVPAVVPVVTGLTDDDVPRQTKRWTWGCNTQNCTYRYVINQRATPTFDNGAYGTTTEFSTGDKSQALENGIFMFRLKQPKVEPSRVRTVYATIDRTRPATPTQDSIVYVMFEKTTMAMINVVIQFSGLKAWR